MDVFYERSFLFVVETWIQVKKDYLDCPIFPQSKSVSNKSVYVKRLYNTNRNVRNMFRLIIGSIKRKRLSNNSNSGNSNIEDVGIFYLLN